MHALARHIQAEMDTRGWRPAELARRSGVSRAVISRLMDSSRDELTRTPEPQTIAGIADAFRAHGGGPHAEALLWRRTIEAMGIPLGEPAPDIRQFRDEEILAEVRRRLTLAGGGEGGRRAVKSREPAAIGQHRSTPRAVIESQPDTPDVAATTTSRPRKARKKPPAAG